MQGDAASIQRFWLQDRWTHRLLCSEPPCSLSLAAQRASPRLAFGTGTAELAGGVGDKLWLNLL